MTPLITDYINTDINYTVSFVIDNSVAINDGVVVVAPIIEITDALYIENHGTILADKVTVCNGCEVGIINAGNINSNFVLGSGAKLTQIVSDTSHLNKADFGDAVFNLRVQKVNKINLSEVINVAQNASGIDIYNSGVVLDVFGLNAHNINFYENVSLYIDSIDDVMDSPVLYDLDKDVRVMVSAKQENPLMAIHTYVQDDDLYVKLVRETDYVKILNNDVGRYFNSLRNVSGADSFLCALDNAKSINQIYEIMADSVRIAPINLMDSVRVLNAFELNDFDYNNGMRATYVGADNLYAYGVALNANYDIKKFNLGMRVYFNSVSATDNYDDFNGLNFGASFYTKYTNQNIFVRGLVGANITQFDIDNLFDGTDTVDNPIGVSGYGVIDLGYDINFTAGGYVSPYVGLGTEYVSVLDKNESVVMGRVGLDMGYEFDVLGIGYKYGLRTNIDINQDVFVGAHAEFISAWDNIGGYADCGFINNENGWGYKIAAGIDLKF